MLLSNSEGVRETAVRCSPPEGRPSLPPREARRALLHQAARSPTATRLPRLTCPPLSREPRRAQRAKPSAPRFLLLSVGIELLSPAGLDTLEQSADGRQSPARASSQAQRSASPQPQPPTQRWRASCCYQAEVSASASSRTSTPRSALLAVISPAGRGRGPARRPASAADAPAASRARYAPYVPAAAPRLP